jgi:hypothetical protein
LNHESERLISSVSAMHGVNVLQPDDVNQQQRKFDRWVTSGLFVWSQYVLELRDIGKTGQAVTISGRVNVNGTSKCVTNLFGYSLCDATVVIIESLFLL